MVTAAAAGLREDSAYQRRRPEQSLLYGVVAEWIETLLARARDRGRPVPRFVERELRGFLDCGVLANGFLRVRCPACRHDRLVPFSCKGRGFCPACGGRRMAETAAHLVDNVLPEVAVRQWVLTLPFPLRYRMAFDASLTAEVARELVRAVFSSLRRRARRAQPGACLRCPRCGAVTFVQRSGDALNLNVHFHTLALEAVYERTAGGGLVCQAGLSPLQERDVLLVTRRIARRLAVVLRRRGLGHDADPSTADPLAADQPLLAALSAASVQGRAGRPALRAGRRRQPPRRRLRPRARPRAPRASLPLRRPPAAGDRPALAAPRRPPRVPAQTALA